MSSQDNNDDEVEAMFDQALTLAETNLDTLMQANPDSAAYIAVAMIEAAVNRAVELATPEDVTSMLQDLIDQIDGDETGEDAAGGEN